MWREEWSLIPWFRAGRTRTHACNVIFLCKSKYNNVQYRVVINEWHKVGVYWIYSANFLCLHIGSSQYIAMKPSNDLMWYNLPWPKFLMNSAFKMLLRYWYRVKLQWSDSRKWHTNFWVEIAQFDQYGQEKMGLPGIMPSDLEHFGQSCC